MKNATLAILGLLLSINIHACNNSCIQISKPTVESKTLLNQHRSVVVSAANDSLEQRILDKVENLPEVKAIENYIDSVTSHTRGVSMMIAKRPDVETHFYQIQVGYNGDDRFIVYYNFYISQDGLEINFYDSINDTIIPIDAWRNKGKNRQSK